MRARVCSACSARWVRVSHLPRRLVAVGARVGGSVGSVLGARTEAEVKGARHITSSLEELHRLVQLALGLEVAAHGEHGIRGRAQHAHG